MKQTYPILINLFAAILGAIGQYLYKIGASKIKEVPIYLNWQVLLGASLFTIVMGLFIWAFRLGGKMNVVYPMYATTFIWGALIGIFFEKEPWSYPQLVGVVIVMIGLSIIAIYAPSSS